jgi:hypothetical protein
MERMMRYLSISIPGEFPEIPLAMAQSSETQRDSWIRRGPNFNRRAHDSSRRRRSPAPVRE